MSALAAACNLGQGALAFSPTVLTNASVGQPYSATISISNNTTPVGDIYVSDGQLPAGLNLDFAGRAQATSAQITGTPTAAGTFSFTVSAWCLGTNVSGQTGDQAYTLVVN